MIKYIKWFWRYYRNYKRALVTLLTLSLVSSALMVMQPLLLKNVFDLLQSGTTKPTSLPFVSDWIEAVGDGDIGNYALMMIGLAMVLLVSYITLVGHRAYLNIKFEWEFRQEAFKGITTKGPDFFNRFTTGDLVTRLTDDVGEKLSWFACSGIFRFYEALTMIGFSLIMMLSIHPLLTLWTVVPLPVLVIIYSKSSALLDRRFDFLQKKISKVNDAMEACFSGIRVVKAYVKEEDQKRIFGQATDERRAAEISAVKTHTVIESLWMYIWQVGIIIVLLAGGYYVINGSLTIGEFVAFDSYILFMIYPMFDVGNFLVKGLRAAVSIKRLIELEEHPPMVDRYEGDRPIDPKRFKGQVEFDNVSFRFPGQERDIISGLSFTAEPGQRIALVGRIGSGKSWAVRMIPKLVNPTAGNIKLDGINLRDYSLSDLRQQIGYVPQEPILFSDTIENNIRFDWDNVTDDDISWAIEVSQFDKEIASFANGLKTRIGVRGMSISGGQKQRLALARALVTRPKILILDDCTSALDSDTEAALWDRLYEVMPELTCFIISHRPATLEKSDHVIVLEDGKIAEAGTHIDLILKEGLYCKLYHRIMLEEAIGGSAA